MEPSAPSPETIEVEGDTVIAIVYERKWPKYVASWSARVQREDADYPLAADVIEVMPSRDADPQRVWEELREKATAAAHAAIAARVIPTPAKKPRLLSRLLGRR